MPSDLHRLWLKVTAVVVAVLLLAVGPLWRRARPA